MKQHDFEISLIFHISVFCLSAIFIFIGSHILKLLLLLQYLDTFIIVFLQYVHNNNPKKFGMDFYDPHSHIVNGACYFEPVLVDRGYGNSNNQCHRKNFLHPYSRNFRQMWQTHKKIRSETFQLRNVGGTWIGDGFYHFSKYVES